MPVNNYIFDSIEDIKDFKSMKKEIALSLGNFEKVDLYVTGLTVALIEVVNFCIFYNIELNLYHYDRDSGEYFSQGVLTDKWKPYLQEGGYIR